MEKNLTSWEGDMCPVHGTNNQPRLKNTESPDGCVTQATVCTGHCELSSHREPKESYVIRGVKVRGGWRRNMVSDLRKCHRAASSLGLPGLWSLFSAEGACPLTTPAWLHASFRLSVLKENNP